MIQHLVTEIGGIAGFGVISIVLFFVVFGVALGLALRLKKPYLNSMGEMPLHDEEPDATAVGKGANHYE